MELSIHDICEAVGVSKARIEQWISRGRFTPENETAPGKTRAWTIRDALRLAIAAALADAGEAGDFETFSNYALKNFKPGAAKRFLVIRCIDDAEVNTGRGWTAEIVSQISLGAAVSQSKGAALVVDLENTLAPVKQKLAAFL